MVFAQELLPERDCRKCTAHQKIRWGCETVSPEPPLLIDNEYLTRCPNRPLLDNPVFFNEVYKLYGWFGRNYLPDPGTWLDQSNVFVQCIEIIESASSEARKIKEDKLAAMKQQHAPGR